jgi:hypothetical protein
MWAVARRLTGHSAHNQGTLLTEPKKLCYRYKMTRTEAIDIIQRELPTADETTLAAAAALLQSAQPGPSILPRPLTARELELIERSKSDFAVGRTMSSAEARASIDETLAALGVPKSAT